MAGRLGIPRATIYAVLLRRGLSRLSTLDRTTGVPIRYVKDCPGELVHVDIKKLGKIPDGGGWRVHGMKNRGTRQRVGYEFCHSMVDDHSRVAYSEILDSEDAAACAGFILRASQWFATLRWRRIRRSAILVLLLRGTPMRSRLFFRAYKRTTRGCVTRRVHLRQRVRGKESRRRPSEHGQSEHVSGRSCCQ